jgi:hypothetical protein
MSPSTSRLIRRSGRILRCLILMSLERRRLVKKNRVRVHCRLNKGTDFLPHSLVVALDKPIFRSLR